MNIKAKQLMDSVDVLKKISDMNLPISLSYKIAKNIMKIEEELAILNKEKQKLIDKYGEKDEDGKIKSDESGRIRILDITSWTTEYSALEDLQIDIDLTVIPEDDLLKCNELNITPSDIILISYMV